jgi:hypothetical protein
MKRRGNFFLQAYNLLIKSNNNSTRASILLGTWQYDKKKAPIKGP